MRHLEPVPAERQTLRENYPVCVCIERPHEVIGLRYACGEGFDRQACRIRDAQAELTSAALGKLRCRHQENDDAKHLGSTLLRARSLKGGDRVYREEK